ncbi:hypothetical protein CSPX01_02645 [Colletotrichum filicis]|nr:hypothetical protein CSPX01_02645 [Colletotrichum filicis]
MDYAIHNKDVKGGESDKPGGGGKVVEFKEAEQQPELSREAHRS